MRYLCSIYTHDYTTAAATGFAGQEPSYTEPVVEVEVAGATLRQAAARAYARSIGRARARLLRDRQVPDHLARMEARPARVAEALRRVVTRIGEGYEMDLLSRLWFITVAPVNDDGNPSKPSKPRRLRLPSSVLLHLSRTASPN